MDRRAGQPAGGGRTVQRRPGGSTFPVPTRAALLATLATALLGGCSVGVQDGSGGSATAAPPAAPGGAGGPDSSTNPDNAAASGQPAPPSGECFLGRHAVRSIVGRETIDTPAGPAKPSGNGGSLLVDFRPDGRWTLSSDGSKPAAFAVGPYTATATIKGQADGTYARVGEQFAFRQRTASGSVLLASTAGSYRTTMESLAPALAPSGTATVTCGQTVRLVSETVELTLTPLAPPPGGRPPGSPPPGGGAPEAPAVISRAGTTGTFDCRDHTVTISAAATRLHLVGRCPRVEITGAGNEVTIDLAGTISVTGTRDKVTWHDGLDGRQPSVTTTGLLSTVNHG